MDETKCLAPGCIGSVANQPGSEGECDACTLRHRRPTVALHPGSFARWNEILGPVVVAFVDDRKPVLAKAVEFIFTPGAADVVTILPDAGGVAAVGLRRSEVKGITRA